MTNSKTTRRALVLSLLSLLLCCSMLVGTTFAWFTDSVTSGNNKIVAGNLDIELYHSDKNITDEKVTESTLLFDDIKLWEPGVVAYENLEIVNAGTLALDYSLAVNFANGNVVTDNNLGLADVLQVALVEGAVSGDREAVMTAGTNAGWKNLASFVEEGTLLPEEGDEFALVICWVPGENDNDWNVNNGRTTDDGEPLHIDLGIDLLATQETYEKDSFDDQYDKNAGAALVEKEKLENVSVEVFNIESGIQIDETKTLSFNCYTFDAKKFQGQYPVASYGDWICDYYVSSDKAINDGLILVGNYGDYGWLGFNVPESTEPYAPTGLLGTVTNGGVSNWTYEEICEGVEVFKCGIVDELGNNAGTNITVILRMTNGDQTIDVCKIQVTLGE